ncbi:hypothetical protein ACFOZ7_22090 [Natribaculum luteum]|uniref:Uncharacterized protein n=1 Tax=Natribaculum luteum TaxID=1586232 RepID=A0ABD5P5K2_9EURY|nr:hypothetical protein [Natribaculum luteum]
MMWQDLVFLVGSSLSIVFLAPTLRDRTARVPLGTSLPSMGIGGVYAFTFSTLGMSFSAAGAAAAATMWSLIALYRSPGAQSPVLTRRDDVVLFGNDALRWAKRLVVGSSVRNQYEYDRAEYGQSAD